MTASSFHLSFYLLFGVLSWMALRGIVGGRTVFEYPTLAAMMGLAWVVPQGIELELASYSPYASSDFWLYVTACFVFILLGFKAGKRRKKRRIVTSQARQLRTFKMKRLLISAVGLVALGQIAVLQMGGIDTSGMGGQWSGVITLWALLAKANSLGLCLAVLIFARTRSRLALSVAIFASIPVMQSAFLGIRREYIFDLAILTAGAWYISKDRFPPRGVVIVLFLIGMVVLNAVGSIRSQAIPNGGNLLKILTSAEVYQEFNFFDLQQGVASEVGLARYDFWYMNETWDWEYGAEYWNRLVHQYVPAFLVGRSLKEGLKIDTLSERLSRGESEGLFSLGSTRTGFSDTYRSFGPFGVLVFAVIGYYFGTLYAVVNFGGIYGQFLYLIMLAEGIKAITHGAGVFVAALPFTLIISSLAFRFARTSIRPNMANSTKTTRKYYETH